MIKYGISRNYLPDWTIQDALREIYQNFEDYGEYKENVEECDDSEDCIVRLYNNYTPESKEFLKIGESYKRDNPSKIGKHGEGLKMAFLILARNNQYCQIRYDNKTFRGQFYTDDHLGECFGLRLGLGKNDVDVLKGHSFRVCIIIPEKEYNFFKTKKISREDLIYHSHHGDIINRPAGEIYVGGLFVSKEEGLNYAYNFKPENISLDRDRKVPRTFDVDWQASRILESWDEAKLQDFTGSRDTSYVDKIPQHIAKKFKPELIEGKVVFQAKAIQAPARVSQALLNDPKQQKAVARLTYSLSKKRKPSSLLREFYNKWKYNLTPSIQVDFNILIKKSEGWK